MQYGGIWARLCLEVKSVINRAEEGRARVGKGPMQMLQRLRQLKLK